MSTVVVHFIQGIMRIAVVSSAVSAAVLLAAALPVQATTFSINSGTVTTSQSVTGSDQGSVASGAALSTSGNAISWSGPSGAPGVSIENSGTISSSNGRGIDTSGSNTVRNFTLTNNAGATLSGSNDAFRINADVVNSTVTVNNAGTIFSATGQALDFDSINSSTAVVEITNSGLINAAEADAIRPGQGAVVTNSGTICVGTFSAGNCTGGEIGASHDGVDWQGHSGTLVNKSGGVISGQHHGTTSDVNVNVTNEAGALLLGRNGSGVGSDGDGTVVNFGTIRGSVDGLAANGDGDGVDIDFAANIINHGVIEGTGAAGVGSDGLANGSEGLAIGGGTVDNRLGARITGANNGMLVDNSNAGPAFSPAMLINAGKIEGLDGYGVRILGSQADVVANSGVISGTLNALELGGGDDLLKLHTGSDIRGLADGGDGFDTIEILGDVTLGETINFERLLLGPLGQLGLAFDLDVEELVGLTFDLGAIVNLNGNGFDVFYNPQLLANEYLRRADYALAGGGRLRAVPEPATLKLFAAGLAGLFGLRRRRPAMARAVAA